MKLLLQAAHTHNLYSGFAATLGLMQLIGFLSASQPACLPAWLGFIFAPN